MGRRSSNPGASPMWTMGSASDLDSYSAQPAKPPLKPLSERLDMVDRAIIILSAAGLLTLVGFIVMKGRTRPPAGGAASPAKEGLGTWVWVRRNSTIKPGRWTRVPPEEGNKPKSTQDQ